MPKFTLLLLVGFGSLAVAAPLTKPLPAVELKKFQECHHTEDCVRVDNGCCDCANSGDTIAVHRKFQNQFRALFACDKVVCSQRAGDCTFREPVCREGRCALVSGSKQWGPPRRH